MKTISSALQAHINGAVTTLATCWKIQRSDGTTLGFTDHVEPLVVSAITYDAATGYTPTALKSNNRLSVDNLDIVGLLDSNGITEADIDAKKYDDADVHIFLVNYASVNMGIVPMGRGKIGNIRLQDNTYIAEFRSLTQLLQQTIGEKYSLRCRADLGDTRCGFSLGSVTTTATVASVTDRRTFYSSTLFAGAASAAYYQGGLITWQASAANSTYTMEVKTYTSGVVTLQEKMPYTIAVGDVFTIYPGCDKTRTTCINKFSNIENMRGEPFIPGPDRIGKFGGQG